jgi:hypothetical protein
VISQYDAKRLLWAAIRRYRKADRGDRLRQTRHDVDFAIHELIATIVRASTPTPRGEHE